MLTNLILILFILNVKNSAFNIKNKYLITTYYISVRGDYSRKIEYSIRFC